MIRAPHRAIRLINHMATQRESAMNENQSGWSTPEFRTGPLITSAVLVGAGTFIVLAGLAVGGSHLFAATRRWIAEMETPPSEVARLKWSQAKAAMAAGTSAWQNGLGTAAAGDVTSTDVT
jgi:hypothetical protein